MLGQIYPRWRLQCKHFIYLSDASWLGTNCDKHKESCTLLPSQQWETPPRVRITLWGEEQNGES